MKPDITCAVCKKPATWEPFRACYVHADDPDLDHDPGPVRISFDGCDNVWPALEIVRLWNGWAVPRVTAEVREQIAECLDRIELQEAGDPGGGNEVRALALEPDGTVIVDLGLTFAEVVASVTFAIGDRVVATSVVGVLAGTLGEVTRVRDDGAATVRWDGGVTSYGLSVAHIAIYQPITVVTVR